jgi:hypothetical protein
MKTRCFTRLFRRRPVPVVPSAPCSLARRQADRLRDLYEFEAVLELSRPKPDLNYLLQLELESTYLREVLATIEGRI